MKILIIGHKQHGKDVVGAKLAELMHTEYRSSSLFAAEKVILPVLGPKYGYITVEHAYNDRDHHRSEWFDLIREYNTPDGARLARELLDVADIYVGMRSRKEYEACIAANLFDVVFWVDASSYRPKESAASMELTEDDADIIIDNNGSFDRLYRQLAAHASVMNDYKLVRQDIERRSYSPA